MIREYIDDDFSKSYTHKELQSLLVSKWKQQPGDLVKLQARIIGSVEEEVCKKKNRKFLQLL